MRDTIELIGLLDEANVNAFLRVIREGESSQDDDAYRWLFGSTRKNPKLFESFADHPRVRTYEAYDGQFIKNGKLDYTTAAGAYQITETTWNGLVKARSLDDFEPATQDIAAVALIEGRGALDDVLAGHIERAMFKCRQEWASLPAATYGQPTQSLARALAVYQQHGGVLATAGLEPAQTLITPLEPATMATAAEIVNSPLTKFALAAINPILGVVPEIAKLFMDKGTSVPERNVAAAVKVVEVAQQAMQQAGLEAPNAQAVAEAMSDPQARQVVREAVLQNFYDIQEAGGGGIKAAREAARDPNGLPFYKQGAFYVSLALLAMVFMLLVDVFYVHPGTYDGNLRTQIVTAVLLIISMVGAFWIGSSFSSQRKDEIAARQAST